MPIKSPATSRKTRPRKNQDAHGEEESPRQERYEVVTEVKPGSSSRRASREEQLRDASQAIFQGENVIVRSTRTQPEGEETALEKAKRVARKSATELQKSLAEFQKEVQRRKLTWVWPALAGLLLALLLASQWRHSVHWQRQMTAQM